MGLKAPMTSRIGNRGFTFIEVIVATAILALGTVLIYEAFFISLDAFNYYSCYLNAVAVMDEKLWDAQNSLTCYGQAAQIQGGGGFTRKNRKYAWEVSYRLIGEKGLYAVNVSMRWNQGKKVFNLKRSTYALYAERG